MQKKIDQHVFQGMQRDMSISKQKAEFLWDANNIRLTSRHGDTLFSMTNERGTKQIDGISFRGVVLGYCILGNFLTVFSTVLSSDLQKNEKPDYIYRIEKISDTFDQRILYNGHLGFKPASPIECLGVYENEDIQKVYWTDGVNQPRFINITKELVDGTYIETSFDFIPTLELKDTIHVRKVADSSGIFAAGVIQYAVTYYNKYGQESNVSVVSPLIATSYTSRAGSPEDTIGNAFKITVKNPDTNFEFLRLYSIFRSSKDTTPVCKRVADVRLSYGNKESRTLHTSSDKHISAYERSRLENIWFKETSSDDFVALSENTTHLGTEDITVNGVEFRSRQYYRFSKEDYPELILKAQVYNLETEILENVPICLTWDDNTDILICKTLSGAGEGIYDIWPYGGNSRMIAANEIYYNSIQFINGDEVTVTDNGTIGEDVDYNELLFVGGEEITAGTITQKDGTMFLGDIAIKRPQIKGSYNVITNVQNYECKATGTQLIKTVTDGTSISKSHRTCYFPLTMNSSSYKWGNTLDACSDSARKNSTNIAGFKWGEHYRLGLQFQYKTGKWSQPVFIGDVKMDDVNQRPSLATNNGQCVQNVPSFLATLNKTAGSEMLANDYKRVRAVVCFPTESDQLILCQGLLNPTVHSIAGRINHTPDVQSSWFFRPVPAGTESSDECDFVQYRHGFTLYSGTRSEETVGQDVLVGDLIPTRKDEIQGVPAEFSNKDISTLLNQDYELLDPDMKIDLNTRVTNSESSDYQILVTKVNDSRNLSNVFVVDWNHLTFHSPEFEFNDSFHNLDSSTLGCRISGRQLLESNNGDIHIITKTPPISSNGLGFYHRVISSQFSACRIGAGLFYRDRTVVWKDDEGDSVHYHEANKDWKHIYNLQFLVYPWHRTGSLNNDCIRPYNQGLRSADLDTKKIVNLMYFNQVEPGYNKLNYTTLKKTEIKVYNSDQVSLIKIDNLNYFGNVDQVLASFVKYPIAMGVYDTCKFNDKLDYLGITGSSLSPMDPEQKGLFLSNDPVYMKYKSTPHAVISTTSTFGPTPDQNQHSTATPDISLDQGFKREEDSNPWPYLYQAEMYREPQDSDFGGTSQMAIQSNLWYPAGPAVQMGCTVDGTATGDGHTEIPYWYGDTYYQRYDCLKTYPFTDEDTNSIIEIGSFMVETRINLDGRYDRSRGDISNFMLNPTNFNLINPVYSQKDNFFNYRILDDDYYALSNYPTMVTWTGYKNNAAEVDSWTNITLASTLEMDGTKGKVNAVRVNSDQLYCFQDDAIGQILFNSRVQISPSDGVPIEISNNYKVDGNRYISTSIGCENKWSIAEGTDGLYFIDGNTEALYQLGGQAQIKPISTPLNMSYWFMNQDCGTPWRHQYYNNRVFQQQGIRCFYDSANADLYVCTPDKTLCYSEKLGQFVSFFDYHHPIGMFNIDSEYYALNYPDDETSTDVKLWSMFQGHYNTFFNKIYQTDFTFISNADALNDKIFSNIELRGDFRWWTKNEIEENFDSVNHTLDHRRMFDTIRVWNEYQDTGEIDLRFKQDIPSNMKKKFRIWRMNIPRDKDHTRQRIRNTWAKVKFAMNTLLATSLQDLCGKTSSGFAVWNSNTESWNDLSFTDYTEDGVQYMFRIQNGTSGDYIEKYHIDNTTGTEIADATYVLIGNVIYETYPPIPGRPRPTPHSYAYRKIHDMEIHDIGVVYYL